LKIAVLWTCLSGYLNACLKELASRDGVQLFVSHQPIDTQSPFDEAQFSWISNRHVLESVNERGPLAAKLEAFHPDIVVMCSWHIPAYRQVVKKFANRAIRVIAMDNCWRATLKQRIATIISPWYVHSVADAVFLPGERQAEFAKRLGFGQLEILRGSLSCDQPMIERVHLDRVAKGRPLPHAFLFIGKFVQGKGVYELAEAYARYRRRSRDPWPLVCCGAGPLEPHMRNQPGVQVEGFVQPERLCEKLASTGCLILPSTIEQWSVAIHEATSAGLLVMASEHVGAVAHLVQDNYNGYTFDDLDIDGISLLMSYVSGLSDERLDSMSRASHLLSRQYTPKRWADTLLQKSQLSRAHSE
jgi:glycosyltransferase involved in cell wall biosynthesis